MPSWSLLCLCACLPLLMAKPGIEKRQADPVVRFSESMKMNFAHAREFSASFQTNRQSQPSVFAEQSNLKYENPNQNGFVNWQQTLGQLVPNMLKFNANYNNNFGPENGNSFGFGPISLPINVNNNRIVTTTPANVGRPSSVGQFGQFGGRTTQTPRVEDRPLTMSEKLNTKFMTTTPSTSGSAERSTPANSKSWERSNSKETPLSASTTNPKFSAAQYWVL
uniref:Uncharacterized protein n=1 Tax=Bursaphelenchus xylophilus TaxID=6326 RepID=A0A1I7RMC9_BURXY